jgi:hypothetical protein
VFKRLHFLTTEVNGEIKEFHRVLRQPVFRVLRTFSNYLLKPFDNNEVKVEFGCPVAIFAMFFSVKKNSSGSTSIIEQVITDCLP